MKISTWNVNGLRSAYQKGLTDYLKTSQCDIFCFQEIKVNIENFPTFPDYFNLVINPAAKRGYAGTAILSKLKVLEVNKSLGHKRFDEEGRFIEVNYDKFKLINVYMPHGGRNFENLDYKIEVYDLLLNYLTNLKDQLVILVGDLNIAHTELDLARPKQNSNNIMFTKSERELLTTLQKNKFVDVLRLTNKTKGVYTWWPYAFNARERNIGWRIDYIWATQKLYKSIIFCQTKPEIRGSDHCPVECEVE